MYIQKIDEFIEMLMIIIMCQCISMYNTNIDDNVQLIFFF